MERDFHLGQWLIRPHAQEITNQEQRERIDQKAMSVLCALAERPGTVVPRKDLMARVWPETHVTEDVLNVAVSTLRRTLNDQATNPTFIKTVPRVGYQLIAPVAAVSPQAPCSPIQRKPRRSPRPWLIGLAGLSLATLLVVLLLPRKTFPPIESLAVLPLANFSGDPEQDYLADGLTEALIMSLARNPSPKIISRTSIMAYKGSQKKLVDIAAELGVQAVLEGSIQKLGDRLRVTVQLIDARRDVHIWAEQYDQDLADLFGLQKNISDTVARQVKANLTGAPSLEPVDPAAYDAYLLGRFYRNQPGQPDYEKAIRQFRIAVEKGPGFAPAHAALAECYYMLGEIGARPSREVFSLGKEAADQALNADPNLARAHLAQAIALFGLDWDFPGAEAAFQRALALDRNDTLSKRWYVRFLTVLGRFDQAIAQIKAIQELDPVAYSRVTLVNTLASARRLDDALTELKRLENLDPTSPQVWLHYAGLYEQAGKPILAFEAFKRHLQLTNTPQDQIQAIEDAFEKQGAPGVYEMIYGDALRPARGYRSPVLLAGQHMQLGRLPSALDLLEKGFRERDMQVLWIGTDHRFGPLHGELRFQSLVKQLGIPLQSNNGLPMVVAN